jgi:putative transposase
MMARPYSDDLRERVVAAVLEGGLSCHRAAAQFDVAVSTAVNWVRRFRETGAVTPGQIGGHRPRTIQGEHEIWLAARLTERSFTLRGLVAELAERGLTADYWAIWTFVHEHGLTHKKRHWSRPSRTAPMSGVAGNNG